jgi:glycosyltransferase involved in cell wall biosynthesis
MKILIISPYVDPAGAGVKLANALNKHTEHKVEYIVGMKTYFDCPGICISDLYHNDTPDEKIKEIIKNMINNADLIHFNMFDHRIPFKLSKIGGKSTELEMIDFAFDYSTYIGKKPFVFHDHGAWMEGRELYPFYIQEKLNDLFKNYDGLLVCNPFTLDIYEGSKWIQNPIPEDDEQYLPIEKNWSNEILIGHSPSSRRFKGTNMIIDIINELKKEGYPIRLILIEKMNHYTGMKIKQKCHIIIDSLYDSFPNLCSLEGMSQEQIAITRTTPECMEYYDNLGNNPMPIVRINSSLDLKNIIIEILKDRELAKEISQKGRKWIKENYSEKLIAQKWSNFYNEVYQKWQLKLA